MSCLAFTTYWLYLGGNGHVGPSVLGSLPLYPSGHLLFTFQSQAQVLSPLGSKSSDAVNHPPQAPMCTYQVQDALTPNVETWHVAYFKLKEFEKWQNQEGHSDIISSLALVFSPEIGHETLI